MTVNTLIGRLQAMVDHDPSVGSLPVTRWNDAPFLDDNPVEEVTVRRKIGAEYRQLRGVPKVLRLS